MNSVVNLVRFRLGNSKKSKFGSDKRTGFKIYIIDDVKIRWSKLICKLSKLLLFSSRMEFHSPDRLMVNGFSKERR